MMFVAHPEDVCPPPARAVDASAARLNKITKDRDNEWNSRADVSRHLERCNRALEFFTGMVFMAEFSQCLPELSAFGSRLCGCAPIQMHEMCLHRYFVFHVGRISRFLRIETEPYTAKDRRFHGVFS